VRSFDCGGIIHHPAIKNDSSAIPEPTEWEHIGDQIDAAFIFARSCRSLSITCLLLVVNRDVFEFLAFRSGSTNGDSAAFAIGRDNNATSVNDLSVFLNG
jgi:hypothetical protein